MRRLILLLCACIPLFSNAQQTAKRISFAGQNIGFWEFKPAAYESDKSTKFPIIIFLHGIGERGNGTTELYRVKKNAITKFIDKGSPMKFYKNGKWHSFVVLSPQCDMRYTMWPDFYINGLIDYAEKNLRIDRSRIYLAGLSMGGGGIWKWVSASEQNARKVAAIATVCAPMTLSNGCNVAKANLPMWSFHAVDDKTVPVSAINVAVDRINACKPAIKPIKTIWPNGGHGIWDKAFDTEHKVVSPNVYEWFLGYTRSNVAPTPPVVSKPTPQPQPKPQPGRNVAPIARAGTDQLLQYPKNWARLDANRSTDADGYIAAFKWTKIFGPNKFRFENANTGSTLISDLEPGYYVFSVTATDSKGATSFDHVNIRVNKPTIVRAGNDLTITLPINSVLLRGNLSTDPGGWIKAFKWEKRSGPDGSWFANATTGDTRVNGLKEGKYVLRLTATDGDNAVSYDEMVITVKRKAAVTAKGAVLASSAVADSQVKAATTADQLLAAKAATLSVFPNPASSSIRVTSNSEATGTTTVTFYDVSGRPVKTTVYPKNQRGFAQSINIASLREGVYMISMTIDGKQVATQRFVKE